MRTLSTITTVLLISATGSAAYAQEYTSTGETYEARPRDTGRTGQVEVRAPRAAFEVGVNGGYTQPFGEMGNDVSIHGIVEAGAALGLSLGYRFDPHWSLEGTGQFQELKAGSDRNNSAIHGLAVGIQGTYHFRPYRFVDPYASLGTGYRMMWLVPAAAPDDMIHGFELGKAVLGVDFRVAPSVALGPMVGADVNLFVWDKPGEGNNAQLKSPRPSTFLFAGVGGHFDMGGDRVPRERAAMAVPPAAAPPRQPVGLAARPVTFTAIVIEKRILDTCQIEGSKAYFDFDNSSVKDTDEATLDRVAECFTTGALKGRSMTIVGHTDPRGTDAYNQQLGRSRAESVSQSLTVKGVHGVQMSSESRGEKDATGSDELSWAYDRRVDVRLGD